MSDEGQTPGKPEDRFVDLTALDFGPAWARGPEKTPSGDKKPQGEAREKKHQRGRDERGRDERGGEKRGGDKRGRRDDRRDGERRGGRDGKRGDGKRGDGRRFDKGDRRGRRGDDRRGAGPRREEEPPPEGVRGSVLPVEEGLDRLAKEIMAGGRTYSVFDLAKLVMGGRDRFNVNFSAGNGRKLVRCRKDRSVWLSKTEAVRHLWRADWLRDFYEAVETQVDPPKGNFQAVAKCGLSGELLGPPNYHGYQPAIAALHAERFRHMALDTYKRKIRMDRSEEAVNAWIESMSKRLKYRPTGGKPAEQPSSEEAAEQPGEASAVEHGGDGAAGEGDASEEQGEPVVAEEQAAADDAATEPEAGVAESAESDVPLLSDKREVERHFLEHHYDQVFHETERAWVPGDIPGTLLSPGLLTLLRATVAEERRYPGKLTPILCRQLSGRHVAVFKWRKKLKAGPSRPHAIPSDISIAERPQQLLDWIQAKSGGRLEDLWKDLLPPDADDQTKHGWYHDLHWLLNQGYALLLGDSTIHLAKREGGRPPSKKAAHDPGSAPKASGSRKRRRRRRSRGRPGLYAWSSMTLGGQPKLWRALTASGLWPLEERMDAATEAPADEGELGRAIPRRRWPDLP